MEIDEKFKPYVKTFPATELKPYAEPVSPQEMHVGRVYFALQFSGRGLLVPHLYPLIFLGHDLDGENRDLRYFQDFDSYLAGVRYGTQEEENSECFQAYGAEEGKHVFDYEHALLLLMSCALKRRGIVDLDQQIGGIAEDAQFDEPKS